MQLAPTDTLAYFKTRALTAARSMTGVPCATVAQKIKWATDSMGGVHPETEALWFYMMNHGMSEISKNYADLEPLPDDVLKFVKHYYDEGAKKALRAMSYLMLICVREARHLKNKTEMKSAIVASSSLEMWQYLGLVPDDAMMAQEMFASSPPKCDVATFCKGLAFQFYNGSYSNSYGGAKWGVVADCLKKFVTGEVTAEIMLDTIWTLCHNGGPIFNKGVLYQHHDKAALTRILDVQRGGQIPQMIATYDKVEHYLLPDMIVRNNWLRSRFPATTTGDLDWEIIQKLGAVGNYKAEIHNAKMMTPEYKAQLAAEKVAAQAAAIKHAADQAKKFANMYQVTTDVWVDKFQPEREAV